MKKKEKEIEREDKGGGIGVCSITSIWLFGYFWTNCEVCKWQESYYKMTPLHTALYKGNLKICKLLIHETAEKRPQDNQGMTPLHFAAKYGPLEICKILMDPKNQEKE